MFSSSEVRLDCPLISFFFTRLGGALGTFPYLENFVYEGNSLAIVLVDLLPFLHQSVEWFEKLVKERTMSEVRSSELETGLSSSGNLIEEDTAHSTP